MNISKENGIKKKQKNLKSARLIVRNLSFKCNENSVKDHFSKLGKVVDIKLLKKGDKLVGCGFVQYESKLDAAKAISKLSGNDFMGRPIIVDWALPKDTFNRLSKSGNEINDLKSTSPIKKEESDDDNTTISVSKSKKHVKGVTSKNVSNRDSSAEESDEDILDKESGGETSNEESSGEASNEESSGEASNEESSEESCDSKNANESGKKDNNKRYRGNIVKEESDSENHPKRLKLNSNSDNKQRFKYDPNDVSDGRTIFLKNIPFSVNNDDLIKCAEKIGKVIYAVVCIDPLTEHSKGTGFVKYKEKTVVDELLQGKLTLTFNGIKLEPFLALKKNNIENMSTKKAPKDNRNLYLVREGVILAGSPAAEGVSEGDMAKRLQLEHWKTQTLRNLNKFVSRTRLVVHNIPPFIDDNKLREIFLKYSPKGSIIREARIMRNLNDINEHGVRRSKGFGFVCFTKHEDALEALRKINNNPEIFKDSKRPIVGFSIESMIALKLKEKRKEKSRNLTQKSSKNPSDSKDKASNSKNPSFRKGKASNFKANSNTRNINSTNENLPAYSGNISKPGVKKMRSRRELSVQAELHHKTAIERKKSKKKKIHYSKKSKRK